MKIAFCADDESPTVDAVLDYLQSDGHEVLAVPDEAWPVMAQGVGKQVAQGEADLGIVMCWTGTGTAIAANKVKGVRAATAWEPWIAKNARLWNDANVLAMSLKRIGPEVAVETVRAFLAEPQPDPEEAESIALLKQMDG